MGRRETGPIYTYIYICSEYEKGYSMMRYGRGWRDKREKEYKKKKKIHTERLRTDGGGGEPAEEKIKFLPTHLLF